MRACAGRWRVPRSQLSTWSAGSSRNSRPHPSPPPTGYPGRTAVRLDTLPGRGPFRDPDLVRRGEEPAGGLGRGGPVPDHGVAGWAADGAAVRDALALSAAGELIRVDRSRARSPAVRALTIGRLVRPRWACSPGSRSEPWIRRLPADDPLSISHGRLSRVWVHTAWATPKDARQGTCAGMRLRLVYGYDSLERLRDTNLNA